MQRARRCVAAFRALEAGYPIHDVLDAVVYHRAWRRRLRTSRCGRSAQTSGQPVSLVGVLSGFVEWILTRPGRT